MQLDLRKYSHVISSIQSTQKTNPHYSKVQIASAVAVSTMVPVTACCYYVGKELGFDDDLNKQIDSLVLFYKYDKIVGTEDFK